MEDNQELLIAEPRELLKRVGGRDELNLAELPITLLSDRVPGNLKTLEFELHEHEKKGVSTDGPKRKLIVTGSDRFGLPTALDDEILVALIQLTKLKNNFAEAVLRFSYYEVLRVLGWTDCGRNYARIEESLNRWTGVTLYYENAWWDKDTRTWLDEKFHIIEHASVIGAETRRIRRARGQADLALSSLRWNEVMFRSFQAGALKRLDIDAYFSFSTSVAKRMYRFLDKRFWVKPDWDFDLKEFAFEYIGLSRKYNVAQIKNKLEPALIELSEDTDTREAFIEPMDKAERYEKLSKGEWLVKFRRKGRPSPALLRNVPVAEPSGLVLALSRRGVAEDVAAALVASNEPESIALRIEIFDWLMEKKDRKVIRQNPPGFLVSSIKNRYFAIPPGFTSKAERAKKVAEEQDEKDKEISAKKLKEQKDERERVIQLRVKAFWDGLSQEEKEALRAEAVEAAEPSVVESYRIMPEQTAEFFFRGTIRDPFIRKKLGLPTDEGNTEGVAGAQFLH